MLVVCSQGDNSANNGRSSVLTFGEDSVQSGDAAQLLRKLTELINLLQILLYQIYSEM